MNIKDIEKKFTEGIAFRLAGIDMEDHTKVMLIYEPPVVTLINDRYKKEAYHQLLIEDNILKVDSKRIWPLSFKEEI